MRHDEQDVLVCDGKIIRRLVKNARDAWKTDTGPGVSLVKSEGRWLLDAPSPASSSNPIEAYTTSIFDPKHSDGQTDFFLTPPSKLGAQWPIGEYRAVYGGGAYFHGPDPYFSNQYDTGSPTGYVKIFADLTEKYSFPSLPRDTPDEASQAGDVDSSYNDQVALTNRFTLSAPPTELLVQHIETDYTDSEWVNQDVDYANTPFFLIQVPPHFGVITSGCVSVTFPGTLRRSYGAAGWVSYPVNDFSPFAWVLNTESGKTYRVKVELKAFIPSKWDVADADDFAISVKKPNGTAVIVPDYLGTPGSNQLKTASFTTDVAGHAVLDSSSFVPFVLTYAPNGGVNARSYVEATLTVIKVF